MSDGTVLAERKDGVLTLTLNDPPTRNALTIDIYRQGWAEVMAAAQDPEVAAVVMTGAGGHFSGGGKIQNLLKSIEMTPHERRQSVETLHGWIKSIRACPKPVIAAVEGAAAGAACSLALSCDLLVAARDSRFVVAHVKVGLNPDGGATAFLARALPPQMMAEMCLLAKPVSAERLHQLGVINRIVDPGSALSEAHALAAELAAGPGQAMARAKRLIENATKNALETQLELEAALIDEARIHPEAKEGLAAFLEKRKPDFKQLR